MGERERRGEEVREREEKGGFYRHFNGSRLVMHGVVSVLQAFPVIKLVAVDVVEDER